MGVAWAFLDSQDWSLKRNQCFLEHMASSAFFFRKTRKGCECMKEAWAERIARRTTAMKFGSVDFVFFPLRNHDFLIRIFEKPTGETCRHERQLLTREQHGFFAYESLEDLEGGRTSSKPASILFFDGEQSWVSLVESLFWELRMFWYEKRILSETRTVFIPVRRLQMCQSDVRRDDMYELRYLSPSRCEELRHQRWIYTLSIATTCSSF